MGTAHVRVAVLLLHLRYPCVQFHQAFYRRFLASSDAADKLQMGATRHTGYVSVREITRRYSLTRETCSVPGHVHLWLGATDHSAMQPCGCGLRHYTEGPNWNWNMLQRGHLQEGWRLQQL